MGKIYIPKQYREKLAQLIEKGFIKSGMMDGLTKLIHPVSKREIVLTPKLELLFSENAAKTLKNRA